METGIDGAALDRCDMSQVSIEWRRYLRKWSRDLMETGSDGAALDRCDISQVSIEWRRYLRKSSRLDGDWYWRSRVEQVWHESGINRMTTLPAEIKQRLDGDWYWRSSIRPWEIMKLCHIAQFTGPHVTNSEVTNDKIIAADMWRQRHNLTNHSDSINLHHWWPDQSQRLNRSTPLRHISGNCKRKS